MDPRGDLMEATSQTAAPAETAKPSEPPFRLTEKAHAQVKEVMKAQGYEGYFLSVKVVPAGCSGLGYDLNLVKESKADDVVWEQDGVKILTDGMSTQYLGGTEVD